MVGMKRVDRAFSRRATGSPFADDLLFCYRRRKGNCDSHNSERQSYDQKQSFSHFRFRKGMLRLRICTHVTPRGTVFVNFKARRDISSAQMAYAQDSRAFTLQPPPEKRGLEGGATGVLPLQLSSFPFNRSSLKLGPQRRAKSHNSAGGVCLAPTGAPRMPYSGKSLVAVIAMRSNENKISH